MEFDFALQVTAGVAVLGLVWGFCCAFAWRLGQDIYEWMFR